MPRQPHHQRRANSEVQSHHLHLRPELYSIHKQAKKTRRRGLVREVTRQSLTRRVRTLPERRRAVSICNFSVTLTNLQESKIKDIHRCRIGIDERSFGY